MKSMIVSILLPLMVASKECIICPAVVPTCARSCTRCDIHPQTCQKCAEARCRDCLLNEVKKEKCNLCHCERGQWICTERSCGDDDCVVCPQVQPKCTSSCPYCHIHPQTCSTCAKVLCVECEPDETKEIECNTCRCISGHWACTKRLCINPEGLVDAPHRVVGCGEKEHFNPKSNQCEPLTCEMGTQACPPHFQCHNDCPDPPCCILDVAPSWPTPLGGALQAFPSKQTYLVSAPECASGEACRIGWSPMPIKEAPYCHAFQPSAADRAKEANMIASKGLVLGKWHAKPNPTREI